MGPFYIGIVGIPSLISAGSNTTIRHEERWFERDASKRGANYFNKRYGNGKGPEFFNKDSFITGQYSSYVNPRTGSHYHYNDPNPIHVSEARPKWWEFCFVWL